MPASDRALQPPMAAACQRGEAVRAAVALRPKHIDRFKHFYTSISRWAAAVTAFALPPQLRGSATQAGPAAGSALHACRAEFARLRLCIPLTHPCRWPAPALPPAWPALSSLRAPTHAA